MYSVKTGLKQIFTEARLAETTLPVVQLVTPILIEAEALANLQVLRPIALWRACCNHLLQNERAPCAPA